MNKIHLPQLLYFGLVLVLTACQSVGQRGEMLQPGDTIDGMSLTTGAADAPPLWAFCSPAEHSGNATISDCNVPPMLSKLAIGHVFKVADDRLTDLNWSELTWELSIDDQAMDLKSFGTYDFVLPIVPRNPSPIREVFTRFSAWDVVLTNLSPGEHTLHGLAKTETDSYIWVVNLTIEASDGLSVVP